MCGHRACPRIKLSLRYMQIYMTIFVGLQAIITHISSYKSTNIALKRQARFHFQQKSVRNLQEMQVNLQDMSATFIVGNNINKKWRQHLQWEIFRTNPKYYQREMQATISVGFLAINQHILLYDNLYDDLAINQHILLAIWSQSPARIFSESKILSAPIVNLQSGQMGYLRCNFYLRQFIGGRINLQRFG